MEIKIDVSADRISTLMTSAIESGDPVTSYHKGGWCAGINPSSLSSKDKAKKFDHWYGAADFFVGDFAIDVIEVLDESLEAKGKNLKHHIITPLKMRKGLAVMAKVFPHQFALILKDDTDAPCADAFLQSICFGEEKYA